MLRKVGEMRKRGRSGGCIGEGGGGQTKKSWGRIRKMRGKGGERRGGGERKGKSRLVRKCGEEEGGDKTK